MITNLTAQDLTRRIARLEKLGRDLADEAAVFEDGNDPLRHEERRSYVSAILDAVGGLGTARDVLAYVRQRMATEEAAAA
jgi:hypothetical protein